MMNKTSILNFIKFSEFEISLKFKLSYSRNFIQFIQSFC